MVQNLIMDPLMKLPLELEEDILSRLPVRSLARFKTICKQWNSLLTNKRFVSLARPQFIFLTNSKSYMIDIIGLNSTEPTIHKSEIPSLNRYLCYQDSYVNEITITPCDDFLFCNSRFQDNRIAIWSPGLSQLKPINYKVEQSQFYVCGLGYDNTRPEKVHKILGHFLPYSKVTKMHYQRVAVYECVSHALRYIYTPEEARPLKVEGDTRTHVSLNGDLFWITSDSKTHEYFIQSFDFSREVFKMLCLLPCQKKHSSDELVLSVFKGDWFSLLNYSYVARKIDILVTKKKIDREEEVVWINLMSLPATNLPKVLLSPNFVSGRISYYIYDKTLVMCCGSDESGEACIYIVRGDMCKKIALSAMYFQCCHCVYAPNAASLPSV